MPEQELKSPSLYKSTVLPNIVNVDSAGKLSP